MYNTLRTPQRSLRLADQRQIADYECGPILSRDKLSEMKRILLKSKIHRAVVTDANLEYEGSVTIDSELMEAADIVEFEQVDVLDVTNGSRLTTYAIAGEPGLGEICMNGAAAHLVKPGDLVIIASYAEFAEDELRAHRPRVIQVDHQNKPQLPPTS